MNFPEISKKTDVFPAAIVIAEVLSNFKLRQKELAIHNELDKKYENMVNNPVQYTNEDREKIKREIHQQQTHYVTKCLKSIITHENRTFIRNAHMLLKKMMAYDSSKRPNADVCNNQLRTSVQELKKEEEKQARNALSRSRKKKNTPKPRDFFEKKNKATNPTHLLHQLLDNVISSNDQDAILPNLYKGSSNMGWKLYNQKKGKMALLHFKNHATEIANHYIKILRATGFNNVKLQENKAKGCYAINLVINNSEIAKINTGEHKLCNHTITKLLDKIIKPNDQTEILPNLYPGSSKMGWKLYNQQNRKTILLHFKNRSKEKANNYVDILRKKIGFKNVSLQTNKSKNCYAIRLIVSKETTQEIMNGNHRLCTYINESDPQNRGGYPDNPPDIM